jgi:hypothetical protein
MIGLCDPEMCLVGILAIPVATVNRAARHVKVTRINPTVPRVVKVSHSGDHAVISPAI